MSPKPERKRPPGQSPLRGRLAPQVEQLRVGDQQHLPAIPAQSAVAVPEGPERIDPAVFTGTDAERLEALEGALDQAAGRAQSAIDMMKAWLDEQRGTVLREIRDSELYKLKADTFEQYVDTRWQMSRPRAYELIEAAPVLRVMSAIPDTRPAVSQALALVSVLERDGEEGVRDVLRETEAAVKTEGKKVTAAAIKRTLHARGYGPATTAAPKPVKQEEQEQPRTANPVAVLASIADRQARLYDELGAGLIADALTAEPARAEGLLRDVARFANRTAYRARGQQPQE